MCRRKGAPPACREFTRLLACVQDVHSGAKTVLYRVEVDRGIPWPSAQQLLADAASHASQVCRVSPVLGPSLCLHHFLILFV